MSVSVRIPTILRTYTGGAAEVKAEGATLAAVIADLEANHAGIGDRILDGAGKLRRFVNVYVNEDDVRFADGLETATPAGAGISITPAVAGGCSPGGRAVPRRGARRPPGRRARLFSGRRSPPRRALPDVAFRPLGMLGTRSALGNRGANTGAGGIAAEWRVFPPCGDPP